RATAERLRVALRRRHQPRGVQEDRQGDPRYVLRSQARHQQGERAGVDRREPRPVGAMGATVKTVFALDYIKAGNPQYYAEYAAADYHLKDGLEPPGEWVGRFAEAEGRVGVIRKQEFLNVFDGLSFDGSEQWIDRDAPHGRFTDKRGQTRERKRQP